MTNVNHVASYRIKSEAPLDLYAISQNEYVTDTIPKKIWDRI